MAANFNKPDLSSLEVDAVDEYKERDVDIAKMFDGTSSTNIPTNAIKFDVTAGVLQRREGGAWVTKALDIINATTGTLSVSRGGTGATTASAARTNLSVPPTSLTISAGAGLNGGGSLSANRTIGMVMPLTVSGSSINQAPPGSAHTHALDTGTGPSQIPINSTLVPKSGGIFTGDITYYGGGGVSSNTSYGTQALYSNTTGSYNVANGYEVLYSNTEGYSNTANGYAALYSNTTGIRNTANGDRALYSNTTADYNTACGYAALYDNTTGSNNTATGYNALRSSTTGVNNTANGYRALNANTTGIRNTATGYDALYSNTEGNYNTVSGNRALLSNTTGDSNTATGYYALSSNTTGNDNTAHGSLALSNNTTYNNTAGFGYDAQVTGDDQVSLGDSNTTVYTQSGSVSSRSDLRDKADVRDTILGLDFITALRPVDYRWDMREDYRPDAPIEPDPLKDDATEQEIEAHELALSQYENDHAEWLVAVKHENLMHDGTHTRNRYHHGIIAQEIAGVIAESGVDFGGYQDHKVNGGEDVLTIAYSELIGPLIKALQEVNQKFDVLKQEFDDYVETHS